MITMRRDSLIATGCTTVQVTVVRGRRGALGLGLSDMLVEATGEKTINCVTYLRHDGAAQRCGVALFDRIISVNGVPLDRPLTREMFEGGGPEVYLEVERPPHDAAYRAKVEVTRTAI